ncbi:DUF6463 family protein [Nocardia implantans]|uniref:DUF6463 family protein n=1 Tax=Nocardia implantans TaxID=3108168 RepID=A0ABU6ASN6_9NOCA|nr:MULTISPECIES: DUF6463 family protein [unclassified Nocardia]MBF6191869.1 hypothetical protein [Nocardia beijingensis]MEA3527819.1 DUF6463 family protein [Nocardia sp. CDC192]MEB3510430.1 DUF6463 family protein [Nocardia sp. CDC186]
MKDRKRLLRWSGAILLVLGAGHLILLALSSWGNITGWAERGIWAAVPLTLGDEDIVQTAESLENKLTFWAGPGSFAVPLMLLGLLIWHLAGRGVAVPAVIGWGLAAWCLLGGVLLVPSPFFVGIVSGALVIVAARKDDRPPVSATASSAESRG